MPIVELILPKMGESVMEATIINWLKKEGEKVGEDEIVVEVATDKVDTEVPSPYEGTITKILHGVNDIVPVGGALALLEIEEVQKSNQTEAPSEQISIPSPVTSTTTPKPKEEKNISSLEDERYYSPLVKNIAKAERIPESELNRIKGTGGRGRLTKYDLLKYIEEGRPLADSVSQAIVPPSRTQEKQRSAIDSASREPAPPPASQNPIQSSDNIEILEMDRMRRFIADHMIKSRQTSAHVTSFVEADVTNMVRWRNRTKEDFLSTYQEKITFTPLFIECVVKALHDFPKINSSVVGNQILVKKDLNIGVATAMSNGNLIVPVIKHADEYSLIGLARIVNDLASRARTNRLKPDEVQEGTFTMSNIGTFGNIMGTPIINQPQVAVLAVGEIKKKPVVLETQGTDTIAIRHMMFLSLSYDHRIIDGLYGGSFLKSIASNIEEFDPNRKL